MIQNGRQRSNGVYYNYCCFTIRTTKKLFFRANYCLYHMIHFLSVPHFKIPSNFKIIKQFATSLYIPEHINKLYFLETKGSVGCFDKAIIFNV